MNSTYKQHEERIRGKVVVITGASGGAGRAIAVEFARYGANLALAARRDVALDEVVQECKETGAFSAIAIPADVTDAESVKSLAQTVYEAFGSIDVWINNAGVLAVGSFTEIPVEVSDQVININLLGYVHGAYAVLPYFKIQKHGILINNISVGGWFPVPYAAAYSASKFGLRGFSEALRGELRSWPDICICDAFPAFLDTPGIQHAANYTGKYLKPAPPVYDPGDLARAMVKIVMRPKSSFVVGSFSTFLRVAHLLFPGLTRRITGKVVETYLKKADPVPSGSGNVFMPLKFGTGMRGGWDRFQAPPAKKVAAVMLLSGMVGFAVTSLMKRL